MKNRPAGTPERPFGNKAHRGRLGGAVGAFLLRFPPLRNLLIGLGILKRPDWADDLDDHLVLLRRALQEPPTAHGPSTDMASVDKIFEIADSKEEQSPDLAMVRTDITILFIGIISGAAANIVALGAHAVVPWLTWLIFWPFMVAFARHVRALRSNQREMAEGDRTTE